MRFSLAWLLVPFALLGPAFAGAQSADPLLEMPQTALPASLRVDAAQPERYWFLVPDDGAQPGSGRPAILLAAGGVAGGAVGMVGGMFLGGLMDGPPDDGCIDFCFGSGLLLGTLVGEVAGIALGVHLANGRRGSLPVGLLTSAGILVLGGLVSLEAPEVFLAIPVVQIIGAIQVERITGR